MEVVIAPEFDDDAVDFLKRKSKMIRLVKTRKAPKADQKTFRAITGGLLFQDRDNQLSEKFEVVTEKTLSDEMKALAEFLIVACKHTKSNAIVVGRAYAPGKYQVMGMGAGQPNRVDSTLDHPCSNRQPCRLLQL